jgi:hypothetical protein
MTRNVEEIDEDKKCERRDVGEKKLPDCNDTGEFLQQPRSPKSRYE